VWIVDDSPLDADLADRALATRYETAVFHDGSTVLEALAAGGRVPDVLVLDWIMPAVSGLDVCRFLRSSRSPAPNLAILLLTAHHEVAQLVDGLAAGANDYLAKPYADEELRARVDNLVRSRDLLERVTRTEEHIRRLLASVPDVLLTLDERGVVTFANEEAERVLRPVAPGQGELVGRRLSDILPALDVFLVSSAQGEAVLVPLPDVEIGDEVYAPTARRLPTDFAASTTVAMRNVTARRRAEARRLDFYSVVAHDLRSPLNSLLLRADMLLRGHRGPLPAAAIADVRKMETSIRTLVALVNDFLDLAQLEGTAYSGARELVDMGSLIAQAIEDVQPLVDASRLTIDYALPGFDASISGDRRRLIQVLSNLLSNAVKFTPEGGTITVRAMERRGQIEVMVSDTGRGIAPEVLPSLFQRYMRAIDPSRPVAGTGLGLMIVREIVEAHGGTVGAYSTPERGSTFWFSLPRRREADVGAAHRPILIIDDDRLLRETLRFLLEGEGYAVVEAENGEHGLRALHEHDPCAAVVDLTMPVMDGWEFVDRVRRDERHGAVPICILSGVSTHAPSTASLVLQKPIAIDRLLSFLREHGGPARPALTTPLPEEA
jgi:two-component system phosphate regulon sensor histidine kinase PhoR